MSISYDEFVKTCLAGNLWPQNPLYMVRVNYQRFQFNVHTKLKQMGNPTSKCDFLIARRIVEQLDDKEVAYVMCRSDDNMAIIMHTLFVDNSTRLVGILRECLVICGSSDFDIISGEVISNLRFYNSRILKPEVQGYLKSDWLIDVDKQQNVGQKYPEENLTWLQSLLKKCQSKLLSKEL